MGDVRWAARVWVRGGGYGLGCALVYAPVAGVVGVVDELLRDGPGLGAAGALGAFAVVSVYALFAAGAVGLAAGVLVASVAAACRRRVRPERLAVVLTGLLWTAAALLVAPAAGLDLSDVGTAVLFLLVPAPLSTVAAYLCCRDLPVPESDLS